jgi:hypothetical protein
MWNCASRNFSTTSWDFVGGGFSAPAEEFGLEVSIPGVSIGIVFTANYFLDIPKKELIIN